MASGTNRFETAQLIEDGEEQIVVFPETLSLPEKKRRSHGSRVEF